MISVKNKKRNPFIQMEKDLIRGIKNPNAYLIYSILQSYENYMDGRAKISFKKIIAISGLSKATVNKAIRFLENNSYIVIQKFPSKNGFERNEYSLFNPHESGFIPNPVKGIPTEQELPDEAFKSDIGEDNGTNGDNSADADNSSDNFSRVDTNYDVPDSTDNYGNGSPEPPHAAGSLPNVGGVNTSPTDLQKKHDASSSGTDDSVSTADFQRENNLHRPATASESGGAGKELVTEEFGNVVSATLNNLRGLPQEPTNQLYVDEQERKRQIADFRKYQKVNKKQSVNVTT